MSGIRSLIGTVQELREAWQAERVARETAERKRDALAVENAELRAALVEDGECVLCDGTPGKHEPDDCLLSREPGARGRDLLAAANAACDLVDAATTGEYPVGGEGPMPFNEWQALRSAVRALGEARGGARG